MFAYCIGKILFCALLNKRNGEIIHRFQAKNLFKIFPCFVINGKLIQILCFDT